MKRHNGHMAAQLDEILENFDFLDDWEDRYRYVIELGKTLPEFPDEARTEENKVRGCVSQVWLTRTVEPDASGAPVISYKGDSDAHIVRGLVAIVLAVFSGRTAREIIETDIDALFDRIGLREHLTPQRSNGLKAMVERIRSDARMALTAA
ncbi:SufE family protein [Stappia albiluteola]|nr:SufE family protein [Stappia albiluteola]